MLSKWIYEVEFVHEGKTRREPCYTCGHCSNIIILLPNRVRERVTCLSCMRPICETTDICRSHCTPIHKLADDHAMDDPKWGKYIPALMQGVGDKTEAESKGLINLR